MDKETLQKKIESGDTVWLARSKKPEKLKLYKDYFVDNENKLCECDKNHTILLGIYKLDKIFATKEEAEWQLEFGNITRTEKLELPTWEQFRKHQEKSFRTPVDDMVDLINLKGKDRRTIIVSSRMIYKRYKTYDRENYLEACRLCKKLFLGEEL